MTPREFRPLLSIYRQGIIASVAFLTPVFVVLYVLYVPAGPWPAVIALQVAATILVFIAARRFRRTRVWIETDGLRERGFFGLTHRVTLTDIGEVVIAQTFTGVSAESKLQVFVCNHDGKQVLRLRGEFWSEDDMRAIATTVAQAISRPVVMLDSTVSKSELLLRYPGLLYWFERHPALAALALVGATAAVGGLAVGMLRLLGVPIFQ